MRLYRRAPTRVPGAGHQGIAGPCHYFPLHPSSAELSGRSSTEHQPNLPVLFAPQPFQGCRPSVSIPTTLTSPSILGNAPAASPETPLLPDRCIPCEKRQRVERQARVLDNSIAPCRLSVCMDSPCTRGRKCKYKYCPHALATVSNDHTETLLLQCVELKFYQAHGLGPGWQMRFGPNPVDDSKQRVAEHN